MIQPDQTKYNSLLWYLTWKDFPESESSWMKTFTANLSIANVPMNPRMELLEALSVMAQKEHLNQGKQGWESVLKIIRAIWQETPYAFGRFFLKKYYRNNDGDYGDMLREFVRSTVPEDGEPNRGTWVIVGELVIYRMTQALTSAINKNQNNSCGPVFEISEDESEFQKQCIFLTSIFEPGSTLTKMITVEHEADLFRFNTKPDFEGDVRYAWSDEIIGEGALGSRLQEYIDDAWDPIEKELCTILTEHFREPQLLLRGVGHWDKPPGNLFYTDMDPNDPVITPELQNWWDNLKEIAAGRSHRNQKEIIQYPPAGSVKDPF